MSYEAQEEMWSAVDSPTVATYSVGISYYGRQHMVDRWVDVEADGILRAKLAAEKIVREGRRGRIYIVAVRCNGVTVA